MAEIRVERKKKGIPLIYILLALIVLAVIAWQLLDDDDEAVETAPAVSVLETLTPSIPLSPTHNPLAGEGEERQALALTA
jgi:hypothetical protein